MSGPEYDYPTWGGNTTRTWSVESKKKAYTENHEPCDCSECRTDISSGVIANPSKPRPTQIIVFSGKAESGKTSAANILKALLETEGQRVVKVAYGDHLKYIARLLGWNGQKDEDGRKFLQNLGEDARQRWNKNYWVNVISNLICAVKGRTDYVLIDDARYINELHPGQLTTFTVRIERPGHENALTPKQRTHISETELDGYKFDRVIVAKDMPELVVEVIKLWKEVK